MGQSRVSQGNLVVSCIRRAIAISAGFFPVPLLFDEMGPLEEEAGPPDDFEVFGLNDWSDAFGNRTA